MNIRKLTAFFAGLLSFLFSIFPSSELLSTWYALSEFNWDETEKIIGEAVENKDADKLVEMSSPGFKKEHPDLKERINSLFDEIKGEYTSVTTHREELVETALDIVVELKTEEDTYMVEIFYRAADASSKQKEVGIERIYLTEYVGNPKSIWANPKHYIGYHDVEKLYSSDSFDTLRIFNFKGNQLDEYPFMVVFNKTSSLDKNVRLHITRRAKEEDNNGGIAIYDTDLIKLWFVPEGQEIPNTKFKKPDVTFDGSDDFSSRTSVYLKPGNYRVYVEVADPEILYSLAISTGD